MKTALYRHFGADGALLYVGLSATPLRRTREHVAGSDWRDLISRVEIEYLHTRADAEAAERAAIKAEAPRFNVMNAPVPQAKPRAGRWFREAFLARVDQAGASMTDIARATGVSLDVLKKLRGRADASTTVENAVLIAAFFGETVNDFLGEA